MTDDITDDSDLYLEKLAQALLRLGMVEMEDVVVDGSEVAGAIMFLDTQLTAGWQLAESVRLALEADARLAAIDASTDPAAWEVALLDVESARDVVMVALGGWDEAAGLGDSQADLPAPSS